MTEFNIKPSQIKQTTQEKKRNSFSMTGSSSYIQFLKDTKQKMYNITQEPSRFSDEAMASGVPLDICAMPYCDFVRYMNAGHIRPPTIRAQFNGIHYGISYAFAPRDTGDSQPYSLQMFMYMNRYHLGKVSVDGMMNVYFNDLREQFRQEVGEPDLMDE